jgi:hypothetical protein
MNEDREQALERRLLSIHRQIQWIANEEYRSAWVKGVAAHGPAAYPQGGASRPAAKDQDLADPADHARATGRARRHAEEQPPDLPSP